MFQLHRDTKLPSSLIVSVTLRVLYYHPVVSPQPPTTGLYGPVVLA